MMPSAESHPQAYAPQRRQRSHENEPMNNGFLSVSSSGNQFLPDSQGAFFSAEPAMMDYSSLPAGTPATDSVFTPNTASSFDSLHPEFINSTYPPQQSNAYMHPQQNHGLSAETHSHTGHSLSPSHSMQSINDQVSPASYLSDPIYSDMSQYPTPFENQFDNLLSLNTNTEMGSGAFDQTYSNNMQMPLEMNSTDLATYNAQAPMPSSVRSESQLLSPSATNNSSPIIGDGNLNMPAPQYPVNEIVPSSSRSTPKKQQQHSPALTNSPSGPGRATNQPRVPHHLTSPIVRIEGVEVTGRDESPSHSDLSRPVSKRSHGSRSANHLSPYPAAESSDDDDDVRSEHVRVRSTERNDDGSWASKQPGLSPEDRQALDNTWVPSIDDITETMKVAERNAEVQDWLTKSEVGSETGEGTSSTALLKPFPTTGRRRAKSHNDARDFSPYGLGVARFDDSGIPGPGVYVDEHSEYDDYDDDEDEPESPPAEIDFSANNEDVSYFPQATETDVEATGVTRPWNDTPFEQQATSTRYQPPTSNAAMMRFRQRAKDVESASLTATLGSRRLSESDLGSVRAAPGVVKLIEPDPKKGKENRQRRPSFLENILPKRSNSNNVLKRKGSVPVPQNQESTPEKPKEPLLAKPKRIGSWGRPKSPRLDTSVANHGKDVGPPSTTNLSATSGPWAHAKNAIKRTRSRSDLGKSPGLAELMTQHGGPPMPMLASPLADTEATKHSPIPSQGDDDDEEGGQEAVTMDLKVRSDPIIPTYEGFKTHARQLNPRLIDYMVERITQEQMRRYKRLLEFKVKHLNAVKNRNCSSSKFCTALGGESKQLPPRAGNKDSEAPFIGFQITAPGSSDDDGEPPPEGTVVSAQFPSGVPLPPVKRLPAEFECPLCFKVKKFYKPSDWTKHVHEDVQPFTCTFPNCGEPKSFKRKADWVRHENERHRQLENWTCCIADCNHTCYRKDNFVQHLVREHKIAEPRARTGRGGNKDGPNADTGGAWQTGLPGGKDGADDIWALVERCRRDTTKQPRDEPCRFCGNICNSWKKLTVHLAKHMEQISMPILPLVEQKQLNADTIISPVVEIPEHSRTHSATPGKSPIENPSRYNPSSTLAPGLDQGFSPFSSNMSQSGTTASSMHTYPPPQMMDYSNQRPAQNGNATYNNMIGDNAQNYSVRSYPGLQGPPKARGAYVNGLQIPSQPYPNGNIQNGPSRYPITPVSAIQQQHQPVFSQSPVDTTSFSNEGLGSNFYTQEPQNISTGGGVHEMGFDGSHSMPYQVSAYQEMSSNYMQPQQHNYQYHQ